MAHKLSSASPASPFEVVCFESAKPVKLSGGYTTDFKLTFVFDGGTAAATGKGMIKNGGKILFGNYSGTEVWAVC